MKLMKHLLFQKRKCNIKKLISMKVELLNPKQTKSPKQLGRFKTAEEASNYKTSILNDIFKNIAPEKFEKLAK